MNIVTIRTVLLAIELGSFSAAGAQLGVPASTISRRVKELEAELGRRLVVRGGRGVRPAQEAHETLLKLRGAILALDDCYAPDSAMTRLRVTAPLEMTISLLPKAIPRFQKRFPETVVELVGDDRLLGLIESDFDLAIRTGVINDPNLIGKQLTTSSFVLVSSPTLVNTITSPQGLSSTPVIEFFGMSSGVSGHWEGTPFDVKPPVLARLNTFTAALPCLFAGLAYARMPPHLVQEFIDSGDLAKVPQAKLSDVPVHALYPKRHRNKAIIRAFIEETETLLNL